MKKFDQINVIPFIDIMLVLLTIVLMTASFIAQGKIEVNLPTSKEPTKLEAEDTLKLITIDKDGIYYLKDGGQSEQKIGTEALKTTVDGWQENQRVTLKIDADTPFQHFITVQDMLKGKKFRVAVLSIPAGEH
ncbi:biopolymer transporter ExbD [uncultured Cardiobacterium sp.]|uniref:biopolymer transporter ExbD n=1 Tax=uncultured Cardiobacterium sp. TaxID=417619 RepID=UPI00260825D7|nr:biopolymer transporter ExbD [uncultured Cardiobacterium sp.]